MVARCQRGGGGEREDATANGYEVSSWGGKNVAKLTVVMVAQLPE